MALDLRTTKNLWRKRLLAERAARPPGHFDALSSELADHLQAWLTRLGPETNPPLRTVLAYSAVHGEPRLSALLEALAGRGIEIALPVMDPRVKGRMEFYSWQPGSPLRLNRLGIAEPVVGRHPPLDLRGRAATGVSAILIAPGLAADEGGRRLGYGGGFYDRFLARNRPYLLTTLVAIWHEHLLVHRSPARPTLVGEAGAAAAYDKMAPHQTSTEPLPVGRRDQSLAYVATNQGIFEVGSGQAKRSPDLMNELNDVK